jgi:hypothetical protein
LLRLMTRPAPASAVPAGASGGDSTGAGSRRRARAIVAALAVTQTGGYGALYYSFAVLLTPLARDLDTSTTAVTGAFTPPSWSARSPRYPSDGGSTGTAAAV